ncbi:integrase core domain-containing protein [Paracoccus liaowanqingii]|uniref:integrase core domain-containing protein n=1 Tax=Paracoccus liaowanqingii TaxID=2560053 RepID=UPI00143D791D
MIVDIVGREDGRGVQQVAQELEDWRRYYNNDQPHLAIGYNAPSAALSQRRHHPAVVKPKTFSF